MLPLTPDREQIYIGMKEDQNHFIFCDGFQTAIHSDDTASNRLSVCVSCRWWALQLQGLSERGQLNPQPSVSSTSVETFPSHWNMTLKATASHGRYLKT